MSSTGVPDIGRNPKYWRFPKSSRQLPLISTIPGNEKIQLSASPKLKQLGPKKGTPISHKSLRTNCSDSFFFDNSIVSTNVCLDTGLFWLQSVCAGYTRTPFALLEGEGELNAFADFRGSEVGNSGEG